MAWALGTTSMPGMARPYGSRGLVDQLHVAVSPVVLGGGSRLWGLPAELADRFHHEEVPSPSGLAVHHLFWRRVSPA